LSVILATFGAGVSYRTCSKVGVPSVISLTA
jgi:hypothetical protein